MRGILYASFLFILHDCYGILEDCQISEAVNKISINIFKSVAKNNEGNVVVSPVSVSVLLSMLEQAASGVTEKELERVLHLNKLRSKEAYSALVHSLKEYHTNSTVVFELANGVFIDKSFEVGSDFKNVLVKDYLSSTETVSFGSGEDVKIINDWTRKQTHGRVQNLLQNSLSSSTAAVLINAMYFKGLWSKQFDEKLTFNAPFSPKQLDEVSTPFMHQKFETIYGEDSKLKISWIHLPFSDKKFSMILILPNMRFGLNDVLASLTAADINNIINSKNVEEVYVTIPKFKLTSNLNLVPVLKEIGLSEIFTDSAHLQGIFSSSRSLKISDVIQKAEIEVDEKGASAVTVTLAEVNELSLLYSNDDYVFKAHHPFLAIVVNKVESVPIFIARISNPTFH